MSNPPPHAAAYEAQHVHSVYEEIASHFSSTRYKPWPIVERFLREQRDGAVGADVGCGNGKYLCVNDKVFMIGSDRSSNLTQFATRHFPHTALVADILTLPHPPNTFDFAISIAVIHHLSTPARRIDAIKAILDILRQPRAQDAGKALIYVWALEQKDSRRGWDEGHEQDVMVPWVLKKKREKEKGRGKGKGKGKGKREAEGDGGEDAGLEGERDGGDRTFLRYYHLYRKGELEDDVRAAGGVVLESGYEKDNWWAIVCPAAL